MKYKATIRIISLLLTIALLFGLMPNQNAFANAILLSPPTENRVSDIGYRQQEWYAQLDWTPNSFPAEADERYIYLHLDEIAAGTGEIIPNAISIPLGGAAQSFNFTPYTPEGIKPGTIYESHLRSSYVLERVSGRVTVNSQKSNPAKFLTGLNVSLELIPGTNNIKIKWDDVWDSNGRINYQILISDTRGFTQPPTVPDIVASEIGQSSSNVTVNTAERKLEYVYTHAMPGREYSIKVVPRPNVNVACAKAEDITTVTIKTDILLNAQKIGYNNEGDTIWNLFWNPIVMGSTFTKVDYELYQYVGNDPEGKLYRLIPDEDSYQIVIKKGDTKSYSFRIDAKAYAPNSATPIDFRSNNKVELKEQIPQQPQAPEILDSFPLAHPPLEYEDNITPFEASIFWKVPYTGEGLVDNNITYDIYLVDDIQYVIDPPPSNYRIATQITMGPSNEIKDEAGKILGYRYDLDGLRSNSTYYFVIYAKKNFLVQSPEQGYMITRPYISKQAVKVIITKPDAGFDRPIAPPSPPFGIKVDEDGQSVRFDGASLVLEKRWYALFDEQRDRWEQVSFSDYEENRLLEPGHEGYDNKKESTIVNYLPGYSVVPHVVKYSEALNAVRVLYNRDNIMYSDLLQPQMQAFEIPQNRVTVPDLSRDEDQRFTFDVSGLAHNTTYLAWITVENQNGTSSDPSDPIIITTPADVPEIPITPIVPDDLSGIAGPNFVDLFWSYRANMEYEIRGGKIDSLDQAPISRRVTYEEIRSRTFIRMQDLDPDTVYYFWIRAISMTSTGTEIVSDYSNPLIIKTEAYRPPAPPTGFGIENGPDGVSENSITYVWTDIEGLEYVLEISEDLNFNESRKFNVTNGSHKVTGLISNRRYYARLYAYNPNTDLYSQPTRAILVTTNRSRADYDSSFDLNDPIYGDGLSIAGKLEDGIWIVSSLGANGHVLSERIREQYHSIIKIDLSVPPAYTTTIRLELSSEVIDTLANLKKELYLVLPWGQYTIRPGTFHTDEYFKQININNEIAFRLETVSPSSQYNILSTMEPKAPTTDFKFSYINNLADSNNSWTSPIDKLNKPIRVEIPIEGISKYSQGQLRAFNYNYAQGWYRLSAITDYYMGSVIAQLDKPGAIVVATEGVSPTNITPAYVKESLDRVQSIYDLKSIKDKAFNHNKLMTYKDVLMLVFDVLDAKYDEYDVVNKAISAGLINSNQGIVDTSIRRDRAADLLVSLYRFKTRERTVPNKPTIWSHYTDLSKAEQKYLDSYKFALEIGIIQGNSISLAYPERLITLGEFIVMLDRTLRACGDL